MGGGTAVVSSDRAEDCYVSHPGGGLYAGQDGARPGHEQASHAVSDVGVGAQEVRSLLNVAGGNTHLTESEGRVQSHDNRPNLFFFCSFKPTPGEMDGCRVGIRASGATYQPTAVIYGVQNSFDDDSSK